MIRKGVNANYVKTRSLYAGYYDHFCEQQEGIVFVTKPKCRLGWNMLQFRRQWKKRKPLLPVLHQWRCAVRNPSNIYWASQWLGDISLSHKASVRQRQGHRCQVNLLMNLLSNCVKVIVDRLMALEEYRGQRDVVEAVNVR